MPIHLIKQQTVNRRVPRRTVCAQERPYFSENTVESLLGIPSKLNPGRTSTGIALCINHPPAGISTNCKEINNIIGIQNGTPSQ
jgi:hypothetical protein